MASTAVMDQNRPSAEAAQLNSQGMLALRAQSFADAERLFLEATRHDPGAGALWRNVASARRAQGNDQGELQALNAAVDLDRRDFMAWLRKAELHQRRQEDADAVAAWQGVLQMAAQATDLPPEISLAVRNGQSFVDQAMSRVAQAVETGVSAIQRGMDETEQRRTTAFLDVAFGRRRIYTNQCDGLCYPFLPADEFFDRLHFEWMPQIEGATSDIRSELQALLADPGEALRPYVRMENGLPDNVWTGLDHSMDWGACFLWEYGNPNTSVLERCPKTAAALEALPSAPIPGRSPSAFFSLLKPRTRIPPHTGVTNTRAIVHLPLIVPDNCGFRVGGETRSWREGVAFAFDDTIEHEAWNDSDELRAVLIFDVWNPHLTQAEQELITHYFAAADSTGLNPAR